jgi:hypothetical protein
MATPLTTPQLDVASVDPGYTRADIELLGVDHAGSSYEGRVFVNNPNATEETEPTAENRYVGSFHIFGHGGCLGDAGRCDVKPQRAFDPRPGPPLTRARKVVMGNMHPGPDALRDALAGDNVTVTIVPLIRAVGPKSGYDDDIVKVDAVRIVTYR